MTLRANSSSFPFRTVIVYFESLIIDVPRGSDLAICACVQDAHVLLLRIGY